MKKVLLFTVVMMSVVFASHSQDKKMSIGIGFGGAAASDKDDTGIKDSGFGINFYLNVMYNINANLSVGLEYNGSGVVIGDLDGATLKATSINGNLLKAKYFFGEGGVKPFVGVMAGLYGIRPGIVDANGTAALTLQRKMSFGFAPVIGVHLGSFQIATSYHFPGTYKSEIAGIGDISYNVWQFNIGWNIGLIDN